MYEQVTGRDGGGRPALGDGRPGRVACGLWLICGIAAVGATFLSWLRIEVSQSLATLPLDERVPRSLLNVLDRGYSAHEVLGFGVILASGTGIAIGLGAAGYLTRRWYWWLLAGVLQLVVSSIAIAGILAAVVARSAVGWLMPEEWAPYAPQATLAVGGLVYLGITTVFGIQCWVIAFRSRRSGVTARA